MKKLLLRAVKLLLLVLFPGLLVAQTNPDYNVLLNAGKFLPPANAKTITKDGDTFRGSLFQQKYYVMVQFNALPAHAEKEKLKAAGIQLIDYIPNLAYTAAVQQNADLNLLKNAGARSIFKLEASQKSAPALLRKEFPAYAIKQKGYADVTIITYEKLDAKTVGSALQKVKAVVLEDLPMFRSFTVRI